MVPMPNGGDTAKLIKRYLECQENLDRIDNLINTRALLNDSDSLGVEISCSDAYLFNKGPHAPEDNPGCYYLPAGDRCLVEKFISENLYEVFSYIRSVRLHELKEAAQQIRKTAQDIIAIAEEYK